MRLKGEGEYFRGILVFLLFSGLLEISEKVTACLATHVLFFLPVFGHRFLSCREAHTTKLSLLKRCLYIVTAAVKSMKTFTSVLLNALFPAGIDPTLVLSSF